MRYISLLILIVSQNGFAELNLYGDKKAKEVGDIVKVVVLESSSAMATDRARTKKERKGSIAGSVSNEITSLWGGPALSPRVSGEFNDEHRGEGNITRQGNIKAIVSCTVEETLPNGILKISGKKIYQVGQERETITVKGKIRVHDISPKNAILSDYIADAEIKYVGHGVVAEGAKKGLLHRFINWIF